MSPFLGTIKFAHAQNQFDRSDHTRPRSIKTLSDANWGQREIILFECNATAASKVLVGDQERRGGGSHCVSCCVYVHFHFLFAQQWSDNVSTWFYRNQLLLLYNTPRSQSHISLSRRMHRILFIESRAAHTAFILRSHTDDSHSSHNQTHFCRHQR